MKLLIAFSLLMMSLQSGLAQEHNAIDYKVFFKTCDSIHAMKQSASLDNDLKQQIQGLDKKTPYYFFAEALDQLDKKQMQQAAIIYQIGLMRQDYYIAANSNYAPNQDWMVAESMKSVLGKTLPFFLQSNHENYMNILGTCIEYCEKNDYSFSSKLNYPDKYQLAINKLKAQQTDLSKNRDAYKKQWEAERLRLGSK